jgi:hypothetical protein
MWVRGKYGKIEESKIVSESVLTNVGDGKFETELVVKFTYTMSDLQEEKDRIKSERDAELEKTPSSELIQKYEDAVNDIDSAINN